MGYWENTGASDEWYTPRYVMDALDCHFDMDVASPRRATNVPCNVRLSEGSLDQEWKGFVWMNPPFGGRNGLVPWLKKFFAHGNGIALVPDRTSAPWFQEFACKADCILFVSPKVKFERPDGTVGASPSNGTALLALSTKAIGALERASSLGFLAYPARALSPGGEGT